MNLENFSLAGRRALVTGASRGIGRSIALGLARQGAGLVLHFQENREAVEAVANQARERGGAVSIAKADLTDADAGRRLAEAALSDGHVDILVLNAAIQDPRPLDGLDHELLMRHVHANFWSALQLIQALLPPMMDRRWGRVLGIGSVQEVRPNPNLIVYAGLKAALSNTMVALTRAHAASGVTFNNLAPGLIDTDRNTELKQQPALYQSILDRIPAGAAGVPDDCVGAALLLCSDAGRYITGTDLRVDGGMHIP